MEIQHQAPSPRFTPLHLLLPCRAVSGGIGKKSEGRCGQMCPSVPSLLDPTPPAALSTVPCAQGTIAGRRGLTCSSGDAQEPAGIFQTSPELLQLHGARVEGRVPVGQATETPA